MPVAQKSLAASSAAVLAPGDAAGRTVRDTALTYIGAGLLHPPPQGQPQVQPHSAGRVSGVPVDGTGRPRPTVAELIRSRREPGTEQDEIAAGAFLATKPCVAPAESVNQHDASVEDFPLDSLPVPVRRLVEEGARSLGCQPELIAVPVLVALGTAIGTQKCLELKPGWREFPAIYAAVVARPGGAKTPAQRLALEPLYAIQDEFYRQYWAAAQASQQGKGAIQTAAKVTRRPGRAQKTKEARRKQKP